MNYDDVPLWAAILISASVLIGAALTFVGAVGLVRARSFYQRIHMPTLGTSFGAIGVLLASSILASMGEGRIIAHEVLIFIFVSVTTPVTLMLLARAALHRDRVEGSPEVPSALGKPSDQ
ncbi:monovalent cation/H(+) antiporter subunit G [Devosia sediminis]|uniref:Cation:proton antiporter n=1 Tax=Devosia sediminis TaxID=2798801 RepID=A0A934IUF4_9HYPH|nr:monovalent cation/H(+) antiporter subunit G [Devosia sediminis]MBJ3786938.1 cation:proton antiporter [Devosia sediminis]